MSSDVEQSPRAPQSRGFALPPAFLVTVRSAAGLPGVEPGEGTQRLRTADTWEETLVAPLRRAGCLIRRLELEPREACRAVRPGIPLATWSEEGGWFALVGGDERLVRVARPDRPAAELSADELAEAMGAEPRTWIAIEPGLAPIAANGGGHPRPFRRLVGIVRPERADVFAIALYAAFIGLFTLTIPIAVQQLVNSVAFGGLVQPVVVVALLLLMGLAIAAAFSAFQAYLAEVLQRRIFVRACLDLAERLPRVAVDAFEARSGPGYVNRFFDLVTLQKTGARLLLDGSGVVLQAAAGLLILSFYHPLMLALSVVLFGTMAGVTFTMGRRAPTTALQESSAKYELAEWMEELVRHESLFRSSSGRRYAAERSDGLASAWVAARRQHYRLVFRQLVAALGLQVVVNGLVLALGGFLVVSGELTLGQLVAAELIVSAVVAAFSRLAKHFESYYDVLAAVEKVGGLIDLQLERTDRPQPVATGAGPASLELSGVRSRRGRRTVLQNCELQIEAGERVAVLGASASGRSTLVDILAGRREPDAGWVALDGEDLRNRLPEDTHNDVLVLRAPEILPGTVRENLAVARADASQEELRTALRSVGLLEAVRALPGGMDAPLGPSGQPLSRSQTVLLGIARALVARPRLLVLDEAMAGVDAVTLKPALDAVLDPTAPWTAIVVSRDPSVLARCDRVLHLDNGRLREEQRTRGGSNDGA